MDFQVNIAGSGNGHVRQGPQIKPDNIMYGQKQPVRSFKVNNRARNNMKIPFSAEPVVCGAFDFDKLVFSCENFCIKVEKLSFKLHIYAAFRDKRVIIKYVQVAERHFSENIGPFGVAFDF